jgi:hypothetical protein
LEQKPKPGTGCEQVWKPEKCEQFIGLSATRSFGLTIQNNRQATDTNQVDLSASFTNHRKTKMFARRAAMAVRNLATTASSQAHQGPKRESTFRRVWMKETAAYPVIIITSICVTMATLKVLHSAKNPDFHFNREERRTMDFIENNKDVEAIKDFSNNTIHKAPEFIKALGKAKGYIELK